MFPDASLFLRTFSNKNDFDLGDPNTAVYHSTRRNIRPFSGHLHAVMRRRMSNIYILGISSETASRNKGTSCCTRFYQFSVRHGRIASSNTFDFLYLFQIPLHSAGRLFYTVSEAGRTHYAVASYQRIFYSRNQYSFYRAFSAQTRYRSFDKSFPLLSPKIGRKKRPRPWSLSICPHIFCFLLGFLWWGIPSRLLGMRGEKSAPLSISVRRVVILSPRLDAVVTVTEGLPVALVPEELLVSSVRNDVIHIGCLDVLAFLHALHAQGVRRKVTLACLLPCAAVASPCCRPHIFRVQGFMLLTVLRAVGYERRTAWVLAWGVWSSWHCLLLPVLSHEKSTGG